MIMYTIISCVKRHIRKFFSVIFAALSAIGIGTVFPLYQLCHAQELDLQAPNVVAISPLLVTSGQPSATSLKNLSALGFSAVIYLAPSSVSDAVAEEADIVRNQGIEFVHIPIEFGKPNASDVETFFAAMKRLQAKKILVHCQVNMRASSMTFLYRSIVNHEKPELAYEAVSRVWSPSGQWRKLLLDQLGKAGIQFDPY